MSTEMVFVTVPINAIESIDIDDDVLLDYGTTDRKGHGYLVLLQDPKVRAILDDLLEANLLLDYTIFTLHG
jgi:hypothetical protein